MNKKTKLLISVVLGVAVVCAAVYCFGFWIPQMKEAAEQKEKVEAYYAQKLASYREENEAYEDYEAEVAFLGDSLTDGYDLERHYPQYKTANRGIGGDTTHSLEERLQVSAYDLKPKTIVLLIGGNNLDTMFENYENILSGISENLPQTDVILVSLTPMGGDWSHKNPLAKESNEKILMLAQKYEYAYVDVFSKLLDKTTGQIAAEYTTDGVHLTPRGYEVFTKTLEPVIASFTRVSAD